MDTASSSRPHYEAASEPNETTALLSSPAAHDRQPDVEAGTGDASSISRRWPPDVERSGRIIRGMVWTSLALSVALFGLGVALYILDERSPKDFRPRWDLSRGVSTVTVYTAVLFFVNIWNLRRRPSTNNDDGGGGPWESLPTVFNLFVDGLTAAYVLDAAGPPLGWIPNESWCDWYFNGPDEFPNCGPYSRVFDGLASAWAVLAVLWALLHLALFIVRVYHFIQTHRTTRFITYDGTTASETLTSLSLTLGPFGFDFRFRLMHPGRDLPAGEDEGTQTDAAARAVGSGGVGQEVVTSERL